MTVCTQRQITGRLRNDFLSKQKSRDLLSLEEARANRMVIDWSPEGCLPGQTGHACV
ncbi:MAG: hypothetical protein R2744_09465 [Bacteroidales bacterium]